MYIEDFQLEDIRSFKKLHLKLSKHINLITGPNNSGKSTIIKSIYMLQNVNSINPDDIRKGRNRAGILIKFNGLESDDYNRISKKNKPKTYKDGIKIGVLFDIFHTETKLQYAYETGSELDIELARDKGRLSEYGPFETIPRKENENNFIYPFFAKRKTQSYSTQGGIEDTYSILEDLRNLPSKVQKLLNPTHFRNKDFQKFCDEILGFTIGVIPKGKENTIGIYAKEDSPISIETMGEGVANIVGLISILLSYDRKLFLIEELENDMHPQALKKLLDLIIEKSENNQFIISTHSNIVLKYLGSLPETKIFYTEWQPSETETKYGYNIPTSTIEEIGNNPTERIKILERLGYDLFDYDIFKAYLIFEESSAEYLIRDFIIPIFVPHVKDKIRTIASQGTSDVIPKFNDLLRLFMYIHTSEIYKEKAWVICDGDVTGLETINKLKDKFSSWPESHFSNFKESNFEKYYPHRFSGSINQVLSLNNGKHKQEAKKELLYKVLQFIKDEPEVAKSEFLISAEEVIFKIETIAKAIE